jgi:hypothetical protein
VEKKEKKEEKKKKKIYTSAKDLDKEQTFQVNTLNKL